MNNFDEMQIIERQRISFRTLILTLVLIFINGLIKTKYIWATPSTETIFLLIIPTLYFTTCSIIKNAYFAMKVENFISYIILWGALFIIQLFAIGNSVLNNNFTVIKNACLTNEFLKILLAILFGYLTLLLIIKKIIDRYNDRKI